MYLKLIKPVFDFIFALFLLPFILIATIMFGLLIKLEDRGSIFFKAPRLARNGKLFYMLKFRSMMEKAPDIRNEDGSTYSSPTDPRLTKVGKFMRETSIDELPQVFNVLKGEMSFLGPRSEPPEYLEKYQDDERIKLLVRPGISGYAQAYYRNTLPLREKFLKDAEYAQKVTFLMDVRIFFKTIQSVIWRKNIYREQVPVSTNEHQDVNI